MKRPAFLFLCFALFLFLISAPLSGSGCQKREQTTTTGEPSRSEYRAHYYDAATAGPGYPGRTEIRVHLAKDPIAAPPPSNLTFPSRWEPCRDALEQFRPILAECGKTLVYVDSPETADCVIPRWVPPMEGNYVAHTNAAGVVSFGTNYYSTASDEALKRKAMHEFTHVLGIGQHSKNEYDIGHPASRASKLSERDKETIRRVLKP